MTTPQAEPVFVTEARVVDAISWLIKADAQLSACLSPSAARVRRAIASWIYELTESIDKIGADGSAPAREAHILMINHALWNAAGNAIYARSENADKLFQEAKEHLANAHP